MGVGAEVHPRGVGPVGHVVRHRDHRHPGSGGDGAAEGRRSHQLEAAGGGGPRQQEPDRGRPDEVELLLDGQGPQVLQRRWAARGLEVGLVVDDEPPVRDVAEGGDDVAPHLGHLVGPEQHQRHGGDDEEQAQRREQPPGTPPEEAGKRDGAGALHLGDEERRDEVAGDDEEQVDPEEPPWHPVHAGVVEQHADDRQRPQPVEAGAVAPGAGTRGRLGGGGPRRSRCGPGGRSGRRGRAPLAGRRLPDLLRGLEGRLRDLIEPSEGRLPDLLQPPEGRLPDPIRRLEGCLTDPVRRFESRLPDRIRRLEGRLPDLVQPSEGRPGRGPLR